MSKVISAVDAVRECAQELNRYVDLSNGDPTKARAEVVACIQRLLKRPDLLNMGLRRTSNHVDEDSHILYYDPRLMILVARARAGQKDLPHNHGVWVATSVYKEGEVKYTDYHRLDDGKKSGFAKLQRVDDRILKPGDVGVTSPPPHDVHENIMLTDNYLLVVTGGAFSRRRQYYDVQNDTYFEKGEKGA